MLLFLVIDTPSKHLVHLVSVGVLGFVFDEALKHALNYVCT